MKPLPVVALVSLPLFSLLAGMLFVAPSSANFIPEQAPSGIQIKSDGSIEGTSQIQRSGDVYTLTGDVYSTIVVLRDDIVIDGAGFTLQGNGDSSGIFLQDRVGVTIKNMNIRNWKYGIKFTLGYGTPAAAVSSSIIGNTITNNTYGISLTSWSSAGYVISGNHIANNTYGMSFWSSDNVFRNNRFEDNLYSILDNTQGANDIDTSNTINGKPVYYWVDQHDKTVPSNAGFVVLKNCSGITVQKLNLANNGNGVLLYYTNGSTVSGNVVTNNLEGITLKWSSGNVISGNRVTNSKGYGVYLYLSDNNVIPKNEIVFNGADGVNFEYSISNTATENHVTENSGNGIFFRSIQNSNVIGNNVTLNKGCGIGFGYGPNGTINGNFISRNGLGIWISNAAENTITWNTIAENEGWGIRLEGAQKNNIINHNNFINNSVTEGLQASILGIWTYPGLEKPRSGPLTQEEMPKFVAGATNAWDDGKEGNYWSDYTTRYPNASAVGTSTVGDTPYFINENNMDRNPLMNPVTDNSTSPEQQQEEEDFAGAKLPVEYAVAVTAVIGAVGILAASAYLVLKRKKATAKTTSVT